MIGEKVVYISSAHYASVTAWATGTAAAGDICRQSATPTVNNERCFVCIVGGAKGAGEPTWVLTRGAKTTDSAATWMECTGLAIINGDSTNQVNWAGVKNQSITQGQVIIDGAGTHVFICTTAGTSGNGAEPTWNTAALGNTTADNTATWTYIGLVSSFTKFKMPHARLNNALASGWGDVTTATGMKFYVGSDHAETQATGYNITSRGAGNAPIDIICCNVAGNIPPTTSGDLATTGQIIVTSNQNLNIQGCWRICYGITWTVGTSANISLSINNDNGADKLFENCQFQMGVGTGSGALINMSGTGNSGKLTLRNCTFKFAATGQFIRFDGGKVELINCNIDGTGSIPTAICQGQDRGNDVIWRDSDLSNLSGTTLWSSLASTGTTRFEYLDCKLPASFTFSNMNTAYQSDVLVVSRCTSAAQNIQFHYEDRAAKLDNDTTIYRSAGASENAVPFGWTISTTGSGNLLPNLGSSCFSSPPIANWNSKTAANVTVTMYGVYGGTALPTNAEVWMDLDYLGTAGNDLGTYASTRVADFVSAPANVSADTSAWVAPARQNTHTYAVGSVISTATNPGRLFYVTASSGNTAASEPAGYASAVDGSTFADGSATIVCGMRFKLTLTLSAPQPQIAGFIYSRFLTAKAGVFYNVDPLVTVV